MSTGIELASAYIQLVPSFRGFSQETSRQITPLGQKFGRQFGENFTAAADGIGRAVRNDIEDSAGPESGKKVGLGFAKAFAAAGVGIIAAGIAKGIANGADQEVSNDKLVASLGANGPQAAALGRIAGSLYADAFGESYGEVTSALGAVKTAFRDIGGPELEKVTGLALSYASVFDTEVPEAINAARSAVAQGLAKDATEALDLFTRAGQRVGPTLLGDVQDAVTEYGSFFKQIGANGPEAFALLSAGADKGNIGIDKVGDAVAEFTKLVTGDMANTAPVIKSLGLDYADTANALLKGGEDGKKATRNIIDGLLNIKDPAEQTRASLALFGTPLEDLNTGQIPTFLKSLKSGEKGFGNFAGAAQRASDIVGDNATSNITKFKRAVSQGFTDVFGGKVLPLLDEFGDKLLAKYGPQIAQFGDYFVDDVVPAVRQFVDYVRVNVVPVVLDFAQNTITTLVGLRGKFASTFASIKSIFVSITTIIRTIWMKFGGDLKTFISGTLTNIATIISGVFRVIAGIFQTVSALLRGDWSGLWSGIKSIVSGARDVIVGIVGQLFNTLKFAFTSGLKALSGIASSLFSTIGGVISAGIDAVVTVVTTLPSKIAALAGEMLTAGKDLIGGLFDGILDAARSGAGFVADLANAIKSAINNALDLPLKLDKPGFLGGGSVTLIPAFAKGTNFAPGGLALVGEQGPELVTLPRGSRVDTAAVTKRLAASPAPLALAGAGGGRVAMTITNWDDGTGYFEELADGRVETAASMDAERSRAGWGRPT